MSRNILNAIPVVLAALLASCGGNVNYKASTQILPMSASVNATASVAVCESEVLPLIREYEFFKEHPEPNSGTASLTYFASAYLEFWEAEAKAFTSAAPCTNDAYSELLFELESEEAALLASYGGGDVPYGSLAAPHILMHRAERIRSFVLGINE